jgi:hypothetical protein
MMETFTLQKIAWFCWHFSFHNDVSNITYLLRLRVVKLDSLEE